MVLYKSEMHGNSYNMCCGGLVAKVLTSHAKAPGSNPGGDVLDFGVQYSPELKKNFGKLEFCRYDVYICELPPCDLRVGNKAKYTLNQC